MLTCNRFIQQTELQALKKQIFTVASLVWYLDDLADVIEDLRQRSWSLPWLELYRRGINLWDEAGDLKPDETLLDLLEQEKVVINLANRVSEELQKLDTTDHGIHLLAWTRSWLHGLQ